MPAWAFVLLVLTLIFGVIGFSGVAGATSWVMQAAFAVFAGLFLAAVWAATSRPPGSGQHAEQEKEQKEHRQTVTRGSADGALGASAGDA